MTSSEFAEAIEAHEPQRPQGSTVGPRSQFVLDGAPGVLAGRRVHCGQGSLRPQLGRARQPVRLAVHHGDASAEFEQRHGREQADRAATEDYDMLTASRAGAGHGLEADRGGLREGGHVRADPRCRVDALRGYGDPVAEGSSAVYSHDRHLAAGVGTPDSAGVAAPAVRRRIQHDLGAHWDRAVRARGQVQQRPGDFVPLDDREAAGRILALPDVPVGSAEADRLDFDKGVARRYFALVEVRHLAYLGAMRADSDRGSHLDESILFGEGLLHQGGIVSAASGQDGGGDTGCVAGGEGGAHHPQG